jgi:hypothetical protein
MAKNTKKKNSTARKLVPAAGMLMVSAAMLASSTYAWFTMSREVEVKNIQMTASVPEDLQISLGKLTNIKTSVTAGTTGNPTADEISTGSSYVGLSGNQGILDKGSGTSADNGSAIAPANDGTAVDNLFWANTADISEYYRMGKIIPASSTTGANIYFTPDASGVGKTLKDGAKFYQVASLESADFTTANLYKWKSDGRTFALDGTGDEARTTLHAVNNVTRASDGWNSGAAEDGSTNTYSSADSWYETNDDGYYVDIPMWIRSSSKADITLSVDAFVTTNAGRTDDGAAADDDELYLAARAAIIYASTPATAPTTVDTTSNLLSIRKDTFATTNSIIDYMYSTNNEGDAVKALKTVSGIVTGDYGDISEYDGTAIITVPGRDKTSTASQDKYGDMVKVVVRVWLEGEDPNCWNPNAGQDFNISLKFVKGDIKLGTEENATIAYPASWASKAATHAHANSNIDVVAGTKVTITEATINGSNGTLEFTYDGYKWNQTGGSVEILDGMTYTIKKGGTGSDTVDGATEGNNSIAAWLKTNVTKMSDVKTDAGVEVAYTITGAVPTPVTPVTP